jgi:outer membrane protein assembly factor BamB
MGVEGVREKKHIFNPRWTKNLDPVYDTGNLPIALQSPLIYKQMVFIGDNNGEMNAYSLSDGRAVWNKVENGAYHSMPVAYKNNVIYGNASGRIYSRVFRDGKLNYSVDLGASVESRPVIYKGRMFVHTRNHKLFALDVETGKILWAYKRSVPFLTTLQRVSRPLVEKGRIYVGFADGNVAAFSIEEGVLLWETKVSQGNKFIDVDSAPIMVRGKIIVTSLSDSITVLNAKTGQIETKIAYAAARSPLVSGDDLIIGTVDGEVVWLDKNFRLKRNVKIGNDSISNIAMWRGDMLITTVDGYLFSVDINNYSIKEKKFLGHKSSAVFGHISIEDDSMATLSSRNRLYVF